MYLRYARRLCLTTSLLAALSCRPILSQATETTSTGAPPPDEIAKSLAGSENKWRATVVDPKTQRDTVPPSIRAERNEIWRPILRELRDTESAGIIVSESGGPPRSSDVSLDPKQIWVVAMFDHFLVLPIDSDYKLFYTEMNFKISQVIRQPHTSSLTPGMTFDVDDEGGRIKTPNGDVETWRVIPDQYSPQPGHTYLMMIEPQSNSGKGNLYYIAERWDVSTGKAVPDMNSLSCQDNSGHPVICGQTTQDAIVYLQSVLPIDDPK